MEKRIVFTLGILGMLSSVFGIFGGMFFQSIPIMFVGMLIFSLCLISILALALKNYLL